MVVEYAKRWLGYLEHDSRQLLGVYRANAGKGGYTVFAQMIAREYPWRDFSGLPWCAVFVHAVYLEALGKKEAARLLGKPHPGSRVLARRLRRKRRWRGQDYIPSPGDIIFLRSAALAPIGHCGIVARVDGGMVETIEGNTVDPSGVFDRSLGGAVALRKRKRTDPVIAGYGCMR